MSVTYLKWWGFSINEGGKYANLHMSWGRKDYKFYIYVFVYRWRWYKIV